jgi:hypothetical protein
MNFSDLEQMVMADMYEQGYNPAVLDEIEEYWEKYLNGY